MLHFRIITHLNIIVGFSCWYGPSTSYSEIDLYNDNTAAVMRGDPPPALLKMGQQLVMVIDKVHNLICIC